MVCFVMYMLWFFFVKLLFWRRLDAEAGCQSVVSIRYGVALWWCIVKIVTVYVQHWCVNRRHEKRSRSHDLQCSEWRLLIMLINLYKNTGRNCLIEFTTSGLMCEFCGCVVCHCPVFSDHLRLRQLLSDDGYTGQMVLLILIRQSQKRLFCTVCTVLPTVCQ